MSAPSEFKPFSHENKTQALSRHLAELAIQMGPGAKYPTVAQLCNSLGVSIMTLNRALSDLEARGIIMRRHAVGIFVTNRVAQKTIALISAHDVSRNGISPFWTMVLEASRERAVALNEKVRMYMAIPLEGADPIPEDLAEDVEAGRIHGAIVLGLNDPLHEWLKARALPVATFGGGPILTSRVTIDPGAAIRMGVQALAQRGCRKIGLWGSVSGGSHWVAERPLQEELQKAALEFYPGLRHYAGYDLCDLQRTGQELALQVFGDPASDTPDGLIILDDMMTRGALTALHRLGLHAGEDIQIASHSNKRSSVLHGYEDCLIRMEFDPAEIVAAMFRLLDAQFEGEAIPAEPPPLQPKLILPEEAT